MFSIFTFCFYVDLTSRFMIWFNITRFEVQHGALCALGYVTANCMSTKPAVSSTGSVPSSFIFSYSLFHVIVSGFVYNSADPRGIISNYIKVTCRCC